MLVEFAEIEDRDKLVPTATNMTVETMPNDNLVRYVRLAIFSMSSSELFSAVWRRDHTQCHIFSEDQQTCEG